MTEPVPNGFLEGLVATLERDPRVDIHHSSLKVWAEEGTVVLDGMVTGIESKRRALALTEAEVAGRWPVLDLLRVVPAAEQGDRELADQVAGRPRR